LTINFTSTFTAPVPPSGGGGGGGGGGGITTATYIITEPQLATGYSKELSRGDKIKFTIMNVSHTFLINSLTASEININVSSTPQQKTISQGTLAKFELTGDNIYDLSVKYESYNLTSKKAKVTVLKIYDAIESSVPNAAPKNSEEKPKTQEKQSDQVNTPVSTQNQKLNETNSTQSILIIGIIIVLVIVCVGIFFYFARKKDSKKK
jgi:hypothetical protein